MRRRGGDHMLRKVLLLGALIVVALTFSVGSAAAKNDKPPKASGYSAPTEGFSDGRFAHFGLDGFSDGRD
jgi:hypothetical protein